MDGWTAIGGYCDAQIYVCVCGYRMIYIYIVDSLDSCIIYRHRADEQIGVGPVN